MPVVHEAGEEQQDKEGHTAPAHVVLYAPLPYPHHHNPFHTSHTYTHAHTNTHIHPPSARLLGTTPLGTRHNLLTVVWNAFDFVTLQYRDMIYRGLHQTIAEHLAMASDWVLRAAFRHVNRLLSLSHKGLLLAVLTGVVVRLLRPLTASLLGGEQSHAAVSSRPPAEDGEHALATSTWLQPHHHQQQQQYPFGSPSMFYQVVYPTPYHPSATPQYMMALPPPPSSLPSTPQ